MSNEEAIKMLKSKMDGHTDTSYEWVETVRMAIKALEQQPCEDCISREATLDVVRKWFDKIQLNGDICLDGIVSLPSVTPKGVTITDFSDKCKECGKILNDKLQTKWIPVKWHEITDEERVIEEYPNEWLVLFDCQMPDDGERILVQTKWGDIELDECYIDDGINLDSGRDWIDDIVAWMPLPQPYKESEE